MPGFYYDRWPGLPGSSLTGSRRNFFALCDPDVQQAAADTFYLNATAGNQAITGVGFQPELVGIIGVGLPSFTGEYGSGFHIGFSDGTNQWAGSLAGAYNRFTWSAQRFSHWRSDRIATMEFADSYSGYWFDTPFFSASFVSMDADGFTINVVDVPPAPLLCVWFAARGAGGYKVGTTALPGTTGNQAVNGLGFQPAGVFFANGPGPLGKTDHEWIGLGASDGTDDYSTWAGARKGVPFLSVRNDTGKCVTFAESSTGSGGIGRQIVAQAEMAALDVDGFLLNWTTAAISGSYHWVAVAGEADVGQFLFDTAANDVLITTTSDPVGIIGFGNHQTVEGWDEGRSYASLGMSFIGQDVSKEWSASFHEGYPATLSITANKRAVTTGSFGAHTNASSLNGAFRNLCDIVLLTDEPRIPGMNWRYAQRHGVATRALHNVSDLT